MNDIIRVAGITVATMLCASPGLAASKKELIQRLAEMHVLSDDCRSHEADTIAVAELMMRNGIRVDNGYGDVYLPARRKFHSESLKRNAEANCALAIQRFGPAGTIIPGLVTPKN